MSSQSFSVLVGAGPVSRLDLDLVEQLGTRIVAIDGGANHLDGLLTPDLLIGDLDSVENIAHWRTITEVVHVDDQNSTDLEKALSFEKNRDTFYCFGLIGGRFDQTLTVLHTCLRFRDRRLVFFAEDDIILTLPKGVFQLGLPVGARVSLFPLARSTFAQSTGLVYQLEGLEMQSGTLIGTSNQTTHTDCRIHMTGGDCLLIVDRAYQHQILDALVVQSNV